MRKRFITGLAIIGLALLASLFVSCKDSYKEAKEYYPMAVEVTFFNGDKDTVLVSGKDYALATRAWLNEGDLSYAGTVYASGVRSFKELGQ